MWIATGQATKDENRALQVKVEDGEVRHRRYSFQLDSCLYIEESNSRKFLTCALLPEGVPFER